MHLASTYGHFENVKVLIDAGADINKTDNNGMQLPNLFFV